MASKNDRMMDSGTVFNALSNGIIKLGQKKFYLIFELREPYELTKNKFASQLRILRTMDIHVTGPGTGQFYQIFLPDGSVTINLGGLRWKTHNNKSVPYTAFMEEHLTAGTPYIKGLYYPINERSKGIKKNHVFKLISDAAQLIVDGFPIPVNPIENLAPDGQLFLEMCEKDQNFCYLYTNRTSSDTFHCMNTWIEIFVHEDDVWHPDGVTIDGKRSRCDFNRSLLHDLRRKYNIDD